MTMIKVARGNPTAEELASVLVVLHTRAMEDPVGVVAPDALDVWADKARIARTRPGSHAWRTAYWPR